MYVIEIEPGRALTSINYNFIGFNVNGGMEFEDMDAVVEFLTEWRDHFFDWRYVSIEWKEKKEK